MEEVYALDKFANSGMVEKIVEEGGDHDFLGLKITDRDGEYDYLYVEAIVGKFLNIGIFDEVPYEWVNFVDSVMTSEEALVEAENLSEILKEKLQEEIFDDIAGYIEMDLHSSYIDYVNDNYGEDPGEDYRISVIISPYADLFHPEYLIEERRLHRTNK